MRLCSRTGARETSNTGKQRQKVGSLARGYRPTPEGLPAWLAFVVNSDDPHARVLWRPKITCNSGTERWIHRQSPRPTRTAVVEQLCASLRKKTGQMKHDGKPPKFKNRIKQHDGAGRVAGPTHVLGPNLPPRDGRAAALPRLDAKARHRLEVLPRRSFAQRRSSPPPGRLPPSQRYCCLQDLDLEHVARFLRATLRPDPASVASLRELHARYLAW